MKKLLLATALLMALATAGVAVARGLDDAKSVTAVSGTFTATTVSNSQTRSCTTTDGKTLATTRATYSGAATGSADLTGPITLQTSSLVNTTDGVGTVEGKLKIAASGGTTVAQFSGVYDHGSVAGLAAGHGATRSAKLLANVSGSFTASGGFASGKIGGGTAGGSAVELGPGRCAPASAVRESAEARGTISAVSSTSITVAGLTCVVPSTLAVKVQGLHTGDRVEIRCTTANGATTLVGVKAGR